MVSTGKYFSSKLEILSTVFSWNTKGMRDELYFHLETLRKWPYFEEGGEEGKEEQSHISSWPEEKGWCIPEDTQIEKNVKLISY
jgi:hypothetical protein